MRKRILSLFFCALLTFQLASPPARAAERVYFVAAGENILPLSDETMPFWHNGYLYISSSIFTGLAWNSLDIAHVPANARQPLILYSGGDRSLMFPVGQAFAADLEGNTYFPGAVERSGSTFVPVSLVARFFGLQYSLTDVSQRINGQPMEGDLVWLRKPGSVLTDRQFANAATATVAIRYMEYLRVLEENEQLILGGSEAPGETLEIEGRSIYLCLTAGSDTASMLDALDRHSAQAAFFCTPEFLETQGDLLRRMTATGQAIGILADAEDAERTVAQQLEAGNHALARATCGRSRLAYIRNGVEESFQAALEAGYRCLEPELDRSGFDLRSASNADNLLERISGLRGDVSVWLANTANALGLEAFLRAAGAADGRCLAWTETA